MKTTQEIKDFIIKQQSEAVEPYLKVVETRIPKEEKTMLFIYFNWCISIREAKEIESYIGERLYISRGKDEYAYALWTIVKAR